MYRGVRGAKSCSSRQLEAAKDGGEKGEYQTEKGEQARSCELQGKNKKGSRRRLSCVPESATRAAGGCRCGCCRDVDTLWAVAEPI